MAPPNTHESTWSNVAQRIEDSVVVLTGVSSYVASKFGLRGFSEALQQDLALDPETRAVRGLLDPAALGGHADLHACGS